MNYDYARKIVRKYNEQGEQAVENQRKKPQNHRRGKKSLLNEQQLELLTKKFQERPSDGGIWTGPKVAGWIEKETGQKKVILRVQDRAGWHRSEKVDEGWRGLLTISNRPRESNYHRELLWNFYLLILQSYNLLKDYGH